MTRWSVSVKRLRGRKVHRAERVSNLHTPFPVDVVEFALGAATCNWVISMMLY